MLNMPCSYRLAAVSRVKAKERKPVGRKRAKG
jgi:hypothetical protein